MRIEEVTRIISFRNGHGIITFVGRKDEGFCRNMKPMINYLKSSQGFSPVCFLKAVEKWLIEL